MKNSVDYFPKIEPREITQEKIEQAWLGLQQCCIDRDYKGCLRQSMIIKHLNKRIHYEE